MKDIAPSLKCEGKEKGSFFLYKCQLKEDLVRDAGQFDDEQQAYNDPYSFE